MSADRGYCDVHEDFDEECSDCVRYREAESRYWRKYFGGAIRQARIENEHVREFGTNACRDCGDICRCYRGQP